MEHFTLDLDDVAPLATEVAINGAIRAASCQSDELFEYIVGMSVVLAPHG